MQAIEQAVDRMVVAQPIPDHSEMRRGDVMGNEPEPEGVGGSDGSAGEGEVDAGPTEQARKKIGASDIGKKANADLRHRHSIPLTRHAMRAVESYADPAAETKPVDQGDVWPD